MKSEGRPPEGGDPDIRRGPGVGLLCGPEVHDPGGGTREDPGDIFDEAVGAGLVSVDDCELLVQLAERAQTSRAGRGCGG